MAAYALLVFCFFKQKPAYEMRISDWSSDVCSSDLLLLHLRGHRFVVAEIQRIAPAPGGDRLEFGRVAFQLGQRHLRLDHDLAAAHRVGTADACALARQ